MFLRALVFLGLSMGFTAAHAVPLDFNQDGISDIGSVEDQKDGSPNEFVYRMYSNAQSSIVRTEFGNSDNIVNVSDRDGDGLPEYGVVVEGPNLLWRWKDIGSLEFGVLGDKVLTGCDVDGDGISDPTVIRSERQLIYLSSVTESVQTLALPIATGATMVHAHCQPQQGLLAVVQQINSTPGASPSELPSICKFKRCRKAKRNGNIRRSKRCQRKWRKLNQAGACLKKKEFNDRVNTPTTEEVTQLLQVSLPDARLVRSAAALSGSDIAFLLHRQKCSNFGSFPRYENSELL